MPWSRGPVDDRIEFVKLYETGQYSMTELCAMKGVTRACGHKWVKRWKGEGIAGLEERSRAPHYRPNETDPRWIEVLLRLRHEHPSLGPAKLVEMMSDRDGQRPMAASTAGSILSRYGLVHHRRRRRRHYVTGAGEKIGAIPGAGHTMTTDHKGKFRLGDRSYCEPLTMADPVSRYVLAIEAGRTTSVCEAKPKFERTFREYGVPEQILSDNGTPFCSRSTLGGLTRLSKWWIDLGATPVRINPGEPQQNGRHERFHLSLKQATLQPPTRTIRELQKRFDAFRYEFNLLRPHDSLGKLPPASAHVAYWRPFPEQIAPAEYPSLFQVRTVRNQGAIKWKGELMFVTELLVGEHIGIEQVTDDEADIWYRHVVIGTLDLRTDKVGPAKERTDNE
jgi:transposase InsO family protein